MTAKRKRPKVRFVTDQLLNEDLEQPWIVCSDHGRVVAQLCTESHARRIAAALNWHEAHKRGEL